MEKVDAAFFIGHAEARGWHMHDAQGSGMMVDYSSAVNWRWGVGRLRWIFVMGCGPLEDAALWGRTILDNTICVEINDVFGRWVPRFDGLRALLGFGSVTVCYSSWPQGFLEQARQPGTPLIDAWFSSAIELQSDSNSYSGPPQGPTIYVGALWAEKGDESARNDVLIGEDASMDPIRDPDRYVALWSPC